MNSEFPRRRNPIAARVFAFLFSSIAFSQLFGQQPDSIEFFENRIRPVLVEHCYECHSESSKEIGGSLRLDFSGGMMNGGDSGPAVVPGDASASLLVSAIRYESSEMPPKGKLSEQTIADIEKWVNAGAKDPRNNPMPIKPVHETINIDEGRKFWAFQPIQSPPVPPLELNRAKSQIDAFLNESMNEAGVIANSLAPDDIRLRRLAFDLTGLPPDPSAQKLWRQNPSAETWNHLVDEFLNSSAFAEHWARHWMDLARYADSNGSDFNATHHDAWRYRDYLIRSFHRNDSLDKMIRQQIAGDLLHGSDEQERYDNLVATTFLMLGTKMLSERDKAKLRMDVVDEQIDTIGRAFLGLTLGCARCHDHKFDPVPMKDYYALAGIFRSTQTLKGESQEYVSTWNKTPLPVSIERKAEFDLYSQKKKSMEARIKQLEKELKTSKETVSPIGIVVDDSEAKKTGFWKDSVFFHTFIGKGYVHDDNSNKGQATIEFRRKLPKAGRYELRLAGPPSGNRASAVIARIEDEMGTHDVTVSQRVATIAPIWNSLGIFHFDSERDAVVTMRNDNTDGYVVIDAIQFIAVDEKGTPIEAANSIKHQAEGASQTSKQLEILKKELVEFVKKAPEPLPLAMAPADHDTIEMGDCPIHIRGEVSNLGEVVPRGFLQVCSGGKSIIADPRGSGRLELSDWLTDPDNPVVARVFVNRVWMHLMGEGIVRTVDNIGTQGERPTHPELLDYLASDFLRSGWKLKTMVRKIVLSEAYSRSSAWNTAASGVDPENRLLWRMHRRRLLAESVRDSMLVAAGDLSREAIFNPMKGMGVLVSNNDSNSSASFNEISKPNRTLYLPVVRGYVPPLLSALDVADPDLLVGKRPTTNVPGQALVLINSPEVNRWAKLTAERILKQEQDDEGRLTYAIRTCFQREPNLAERGLAKQYFGDPSSESNHWDSLLHWQEFVAAMFASAEFRMLD